MRHGDEANPYIFYSMIEACVFAKEEWKKANGQRISVMEIVEIASIREY